MAVFFLYASLPTKKRMAKACVRHSTGESVCVFVDKTAIAKKMRDAREDFRLFADYRASLENIITKPRNPRQSFPL